MSNNLQNNAQPDSPDIHVHQELHPQSTESIVSYLTDNNKSNDIVDRDVESNDKNNSENVTQKSRKISVTSSNSILGDDETSVRQGLSWNIIKTFRYNLKLEGRKFKIRLFIFNTLIRDIFICNTFICDIFTGDTFIHDTCMRDTFI